MRVVGLGLEGVPSASHDAPAYVVYIRGASSWHDVVHPGTALLSEFPLSMLRRSRRFLAQRWKRIRTTYRAVVEGNTHWNGAMHMAFDPGFKARYLAAIGD